MKISVEKIYRVYDDNSGYFIEVGPDPDGIGMISISTNGNSSKVYGQCNIVIDREMALILSKTICELANEETYK